MTTTAELERIAERAIWPSGSTDVVGVVDVKPGGRLPNGSPSGIGGETRYGAAFFDGLRRSPAIAMFEKRTDADRLIRILKDGSTLRSGPRSVAALTEAGSAERGSVPSARSQRRSSARSRGRSLDGIQRSDGAPMPQDAGSPGAPSSTAPQGPEHAAGATRDGVRCKACGRSLAALPPSRNGQRRQTCNDACRQAYRRGHRAPVPGVVGVDAIAALSRPPRPLETVAERFWAKVDRSAGADACWPWTSGLTEDGYGQFAGPAGERLRAHRVAYELTHGALPPGLFACHGCDNRPCCNPKHLFAGTAKDNYQDSLVKGRARLRHAPTGFGRGDPDPAPDPNQLAMSLGHTPAS